MIEVTTKSTTVYVITDNTGRVYFTSNSPQRGQTGILFEDEGTALGTKGTVDEVNFVGSGVAATRSGNRVTVTVSSSGGGSPAILVEGGAERKVSAMTALTAANADGSDLLPIVDVSDTTDEPSGTNKNITVTEFKKLSNYHTLFCRTTSVAVSGSASETLLDSFLVTPDMINANGILEMIFKVTKSGTVSNMTLRVRIGTANDLTGTVVAVYTTGAASVTYNTLQRVLLFKGSKTSQEMLSGAFSSFTDANVLASTMASLAIDFTVNNYIVLSTSGDNSTITCRGSLLTMMS